MKCTGFNTIIKEIPEEAVSTGGIFLGETKDVKYKRGTVIAFGDQTKNVSVDDIVWFDGYRASDITYKGDYFKVLRYEDIVIIED